MYIPRMTRERGNFPLSFFFAALAMVGPLHAETIVVPNNSFESPVTPYADPRIDFWQQTPDWTNTASGLFSNFIPGTPPIDNCDSNQVAYVFAAPGVAIFQDYDSTDWLNPAPLHAFPATYETGKTYTLTVGLIGGGGGMSPGSTFQISLYYRDAASNLVTIAATMVTNTPQLFPTNTHLVDFQVELPAVKPSDAWAGRHIGIELTAGPELSSGYWDLDNVRLTATATPALVPGVWTNGQFTLTLLSQPGLAFDLLAATNPVLPGSNWTRVATLTNLTGKISFTDGGASPARRFYRAHQVP